MQFKFSILVLLFCVSLAAMEQEPSHKVNRTDLAFSRANIIELTQTESGSVISEENKLLDIVNPADRQEILHFLKAINKPLKNYSYPELYELLDLIIKKEQGRKPLFFKEIFFRLNDILELISFKQSALNCRNYIGTKFGHYIGLPHKTEIKTGNWENLFLLLKQSKATMAMLQTEKESEEDIFTSSDTGSRKSNRQLPKLNFTDEQLQFLEILEQHAEQVAKYIADELQDKQYKEFTEGEKLNIIISIVRITYEDWHRNNRIFIKLREILKLNNFEGFAFNEESHKALFRELKWLIHRNDYHISVCLQTPAAINYLKKLIDQDPEKKRWAESDLCFASRYNDIPKICVLLETGIDINCEIPFGTPLYMAENLPVIQLLINKGANVNKRTDDRKVLRKWLMEKDRLLQMKKEFEDDPALASRYNWRISLEQCIQEIESDIEKVQRIIDYLLSVNAKL